MWAKKSKGKRWTNVLAMCNTMEQPTLDQRNIKSTKSLTLIEVFSQFKGNELNRPFIHCFFLFLSAFHFFSNFYLFPFFIFHLFFKWKRKTSKGTIS